MKKKKAQSSEQAFKQAFEVTAKQLIGIFDETLNPYRCNDDIIDPELLDDLIAVLVKVIAPISLVQESQHQCFFDLAAKVEQLEGFAATAGANAAGLEARIQYLEAQLSEDGEVN